MPMPTHILPTTVVGSYPQPEWLVNREMLSKIVPRTRAKEIWRVPEPLLEQAQACRAHGSPSADSTVSRYTACPSALQRSRKRLPLK